MDSLEFVEKSKEFILSKEEIFHYDLIDRFNNQFDIKPRVNTLPEIEIKNQIVKFVENFQTGLLRFLLISFEDFYSIKGSMIYFASSDYYRIFIDQSNNEIFAEEFDDSERLIPVAKDDAHFFDVLLVLQEFCSKRYRKIVELNDKSISNEYYNRCLIAAGGIRYKQFYKTIGLFIA